MYSDHDYEHAILEIRKRLHDPRGSKAAVFVGAGFSRNAIGYASKHIIFPLWQDLTEGLVKRLYPTEAGRTKVLERAGATSAALRLAQEFETAFGRARLIDFVQDAIRDDEFQPSRLHRELLELPWTDVFTTNYDCLLEKANRSLWKRYYDTVSTVSELPLARRPRIVKLHGSFPALEHLVLTEEDYRNYRRNYAPLVATVQAALTENILCLFGFSGDDPNFLAWSGWLRDELRNAVPKTYLFTGDEMKPFQRQLLEDRHIVPIPLKRIANTDSYEKAYEWLFGQLARRPESPTSRWNVFPQQTIAKDDPSIIDEPVSPRSQDWIDTAIAWRSHRQQYKGWCVLHRDAVKQLWSSTDSWVNDLLKVVWGDWPEPTCNFVLHEIVWRWSTAMRPLYDKVVFKVLDPQMEQFVQWRQTFTGTTWHVKGKTQAIEVPVAELDSAYCLLMQECLRHAREIGDEERFQRLLERIRNDHSTVPTEVLNDREAYIRYQEILHSLGHLKYAVARDQLEAWNTSTAAPIWSIRRAGLCLECDLIPLARGLLEATLARIRAVPSPALDVHELSCEGITLYLLAMLHETEESAQQARAAASKKASAAHNANQEEADATRTSEKSAAISPSGDTPLDETSQQQIRERLMRLADFGCNPSDHLDWLKLATSPKPKATKGHHRYEGFDIGNIRRTVSSGDEPQWIAAYEAMRFIEDAGLPLKRTLASHTVTIAGKLFHNAARTIGYFAPHEAIGLVLRSRDKTLVEDTFTRKCLVEMSKSQVESLANTTVDAVREAVRHLRLPTEPIESIDHFWEEQFKVACEALGRIGMRLSNDRVASIFQEMTALPQHPHVRDSLWRRDALAKCIERLGSAVDKHTARSLLPELLQLPVRGSDELPNKHDWYDPARIITHFNWDRDSDWKAQCSKQVDGIVARIETARGDERINLCRRATDLLWAHLLSPTQIKTFASSLYTHCDEYGLPAETGCYDSLVLLLPRNTNHGERGMFRKKYLSTVPSDPETWQNLQRTTFPLQKTRSNKQRNITWTKKDVSSILSISSTWLESIEPLSTDVNKGGAEQAWLNMADTKGSPAARQAALCDWLAALENTVLLNRHAVAEQLDQAEALIKKAQRDGWCAARAVPARVLLGKMTIDEAVEDIRQRLGDRESLNVRQACDAIVRWCDLQQTRGLEIPKELIRLLGDTVALHRHESLPLLIAVSTDALDRLDESCRMLLLQLVEPGLTALLSETDYTVEPEEETLTIGMKMRIRVACARLARTAAGLGLSCPAVDRWTTAIRNDMFADVRRHLSM